MHNNSAKLKKALVEQSWDLPQVAKAAGGIEYYPHHDVWILKYRTGGNFRMDIGRLSEWLDKEAMLKLRKYMIVRLRKGAASTHRVSLSRLYSCLKRAGMHESKEITDHHLRVATATENKFLRAFVRGWHKSGFGILNEDAVEWINQVHVKHEPYKNEHVMDREKGPLWEEEYRLIWNALHRSAEDKTISLEQYVLALTFFVTGARPVELALTHCSSVGKGKITVPRAKMGQILGEDYETMVKDLNTNMTEILHLHVQERMALHEGQDADNVRLFKWVDERSLSHAFSDIIKKLDVFYEGGQEDGKIVKMSPKRARSTLITRLLEHGTPPEVIAYTVGHATLDAMRAYIRSRPTKAERMEQAKGKVMEAIGQAFLGKPPILKNQRAAGSLNVNHRYGDIGSCERNLDRERSCDRPAPIACLSCKFWVPDIEAELDPLINELLEERQRELERAQLEREELGEVYANYTTIATILDHEIAAGLHAKKLIEEARKAQKICTTTS